MHLAFFIIYKYYIQKRILQICKHITVIACNRD